MENCIFKKAVVTGSTKEEALSGYVIARDVTKSYKKWVDENPEGTTEQLDEFMKEVLHKNTKNQPNVYCFYTITPAVSNSLSRPYSITNVVTGPRKFKSVFEVVDTNTNTILETVVGKKSDAASAVKNLYIAGHQTPVHVRTVRVEVDGEGNPVKDSAVLRGELKVSTGTQPGEYVVFGYMS